MKNSICWVLVALVVTACGSNDTPIVPENHTLLPRKVVRIVHKQNNTVIRTQTFKYNSDNSIASITTTPEGTGALSSAVYSYAYKTNEIMRICTLSNGKADTSTYQLINGNIVSETLIRNHSTQQINNYTYDSQGELSQLHLSWGTQDIRFLNHELIEWNDHQVVTDSSIHFMRSLEYRGNEIRNNSNIDLMFFILTDVSKVPLHLDHTGKRSVQLPSKVSRFYGDQLVYDCMYNYKKDPEGYINQIAWTESDVVGSNTIDFYYE